MSESESSKKIRDIILNTRKPLVLRNFKHNWVQFQDGLANWCRTLDIYRKEPLYFECMSINDTQTPQWERKRKVKQIDAEDFLQNVDSEQWDGYWFGLNYKRANELPSKCTEGIDFSCFGFPNAHRDCTFWLSSKGSNTPCHYDTYGCNIVVQIYGRKLWLLFPPETNLTATRIPYEESSVYCLENFYAPHPEEMEKYKQLKDSAYSCILEPNDVLIVPRHWWHYVETMETSLSVNTWIRLDVDIENQIEEAIVQYLMESFAHNMSPAHTEYILNPNQITNIAKNNRIFDILNFLLQKREFKTDADDDVQRYSYMSEVQLQELLDNCEMITSVPKADNTFNDIMQANNLRCQLRSRDDSNGESDDNSPLNPLQEILIASICSPHIVQNIKHEFYKQWKSKENLITVEK